MKLEVLWFQDTLVPSLEQKSSLCFLIYFSSLEPMNTSCQIKILRNPISARLIAHSFFRVWLNLGCSTKYFSMNMFPQCRMTMGKAKVRWVAFCRSLPRGEFLCEALHHWSATANQEMLLVMIFEFEDLWSWWEKIILGSTKTREFDWSHVQLDNSSNVTPTRTSILWVTHQMSCKKEIWFNCALRVN